MSSTLWIFYDQYVQRATVDGLPTFIGPGEQATLRISSLKNDIQVRDQDGQCLIMTDGEELHTLPSGESCELTIDGKPYSFLYVGEAPSEKKYYMGHANLVTISNEPSANIVLPSDIEMDCTLLCERKEWTLYPKEGTQAPYVNGRKVSIPTQIVDGDEMLFGRVLLKIIEGNILVVESNETYETTLTQVETPTSLMQQQYPIYRRTPRMIYEQPTDKVEFSMPSEEIDDVGRPLWMILLPPVAIIVIMVTISIVFQRTWMLFMSVPIMTVMAVVATTMFFREKKKRKQKEEKRKRVYSRYLEVKRDELQALADAQRHALMYHFPTFEQMKNKARRVSSRIWERTIDNNDFLDIRIGRSSVPASFELNQPSDELSNRDRDELMDDFDRFREKYSHLENAPLRLSVARGALGYVGKPSIVEREVSQIIGQLAFAHSYHDLRFVAILNEEQRKKWEWMNWLPHFQLPGTEAKGFIYDEKACDHILNPLYHMLRERDLAQKETVEKKREKKRFLPHIVFFVANRSLIAEHGIMEYLEGKDKELGFTVIFLTDVAQNLNEHVHTIVKAVNRNEGEIVLLRNISIHKRFQFDAYDPASNENYARMLASLHHQQGMTRSIPDMVSFMEMFPGVIQAKDLEIKKRWQTNDSTKSLAVPIGLKAKDELLELDAHEKMHGPHGLLAGTTGSGKSEFLQTYILSLAVNYHPHEVAFLLIDYKGGGMAQPFKGMPHLLGVITNIAESENFSARALASIRSELKKRQRLFDEHTVNHINDYTELYKAGTAKEPMPHLFIISDEFAELKNEEPEFIKELVSAARIGRSLGVHLLLATQKPSGVVDGQIWSNSRFRIALKVQNATDSREILKNEDAAYIKETGRGYLQIGSNEQYDLFQSAWSGAQYLRSAHDGEEEIAYVTDLGLKLVSRAEIKEDREQESITEIEAVVNEIAATTDELAIVPAKSPWLDPLEERIFYEATSSEDEAQAFPFALADDPENQRQFPICYDWGKSGNLMIFGTSGYGKSTTLLTLLLAFAEKRSPEQANYYVLDFGNGALLPLRQLRHTGDYIKMDEGRKLEKLIDYIEKEMERRSELFMEREVSNISVYNEVSDEPLPSIFIVIDNYDILPEEFSDQAPAFTRFARDGQSRGIYVFATVTARNAVKPVLLNSMNMKICHYMIEKTDLTSLLGRVPFAIESVPGRMIVAKDKNWLAHTYLPAKGENDFEVIENVKARIQTINDRYEDSKLPKSMAMLPKTLTLTGLRERIKEEPRLGIPLGLNEETVQPVYIDQDAGAHMVIAGEPKRGKSNVLKVILSFYFETDVEKIVLCDGVDRPLFDFSRKDKALYPTNAEELQHAVEELKQVMEERRMQYDEALQAGTEIPQFRPYLFVIDSFNEFKKMLGVSKEPAFAEMMQLYGHLEFRVIVAADHKDVSLGRGGVMGELKSARQLVLLVKKSAQSLVSFTHDRTEKLEDGFGYHVVNGRDTKIKIPEVVKEEAFIHS
ncbi:type VII secretion protein EssC [Halalkalibacterium halodurans]|uniref:type VII secretion protein EssC n=1 Tax=Halalkalibacterium halodurans TaxID=86665 RepID=UPI002E1B2963|nr:type VII secretion protein EssC [Halalkalibacterium halodurans]MED4082024.1 type VII secretion protein EssC [Halalkalibacterium halodurans]MED4085541.1 type VII secretion protein EssC [Halalkalibacterium halodurans]MED4103411.1 type VII secretion protein EssC [Halalkalibacterium halodurans]MED4124183.1 type VII secretion protein EssC [Halalkalibacterium halodurans]MED4149928.1 type VII secretion protein EssC [Halalkalibacterium halodurans]